MERIRDIQEIVKKILIATPEARNSDDLLYVMTAKVYNSHAGSCSLEQVMTDRRNLGIPSYESVSRARRKVQAAREDLRACKAVEDGRFENYKLAVEYATE